jgi:hypothetical protein
MGCGVARAWRHRLIARRPDGADLGGLKANLPGMMRPVAASPLPDHKPPHRLAARALDSGEQFRLSRYATDTAKLPLALTGRRRGAATAEASRGFDGHHHNATEPTGRTDVLLRHDDVSPTWPPRRIGAAFSLGRNTYAEETKFPLRNDSGKLALKG